MGRASPTVPEPKSPRLHRDPEAERALAEQLVLRISQHRQAGRAALLVGDLRQCASTSCGSLVPRARPGPPRRQSARTLCLPTGSSKPTRFRSPARSPLDAIPRAAETWRRVAGGPSGTLCPGRSRPVGSAADAARQGDPRQALRIRHAASALDATAMPPSFMPRTVRRASTRERRSDCISPPLESIIAPHGPPCCAIPSPTRWPDQDPRWWSRGAPPDRCKCDHPQAEALGRARPALFPTPSALVPHSQKATSPPDRSVCGRSAARSEPVALNLPTKTHSCAFGSLTRAPPTAFQTARGPVSPGRARLGRSSPNAPTRSFAQAEGRGLGNRDAERTARPFSCALVHADWATALTVWRPRPDRFPASRSARHSS